MLDAKRVGWIGVSVVALLVLVRCLPFLLWPELSFDADQAVTGLMARHLAEGRAFPVFQYAQHYVLVLESWLLAPLMLFGGGSSPALVKSVPVVLNVITGGLLYATLARTGGLRPWTAALAATPFVLAGPSTTRDLTDALGMNIEPLLFTLVLWHVRQRAVLLGVTAAVAVLNREFVVYAIAALGLVHLLETGRDWWRAWRRHVVALLAFLLTWSVVGLLKQHSSPLGPGTHIEQMPRRGHNLATTSSFVCFERDHLGPDVNAVATDLLPLMLGLGHEPAMVSRRAHSASARPVVAWVLVTGVLLAGAARGLWRGWRHGATPATLLGCYLLLTGCQAIAVYATLRCGHIGVGNLRYMLVGLLAPIGALVLALDRERGRAAWTVVVAATVTAWAGIMTSHHIRLWREVLASPPVPEHRLLANHLLSQGHHFIVTDYWTGYHVAFLTGERVKALTEFERVAEYTRDVNANMERAVQVRRRQDTPCPGGVPIAEWLICPSSQTSRSP